MVLQHWNTGMEPTRRTAYLAAAAVDCAIVSVEGQPQQLLPSASAVV